MGSYGRHLDGAGKELIRRGTDINTGVTMTKQADRDEADINQIIKRFEKTGMLTVNQREAFFGDVSGLTDYKTALDTVNEANNLFKGMSAEIRTRFDNDPALMIQFLDNEDNYEEAVKLGMVVRRPEVAPEPPDVPLPSVTPSEKV